MLNDLKANLKLQLYYKDHFPSLYIFLFQKPIELEPSPFTLSIPWSCALNNFRLIQVFQVHLGQGLHI
jgi:hypothetical protein